MKMLTKDDIFAQIIAHQAEIQAFGVKRLGLFGSFVRKAQHGGSDIDLVVEFEPGAKTFDNFMHLSFFLEDLFKRRVEVVTPESLSPYIGPHILNTIEYANFTN